MTRNFSEILLRTRKELETTTPVAPAVPRVFAFSVQAEQSIVVDPKSPGGVNSPHGLILFDGVCVLCSRGCGFVSKHDRRAYFRIVPMQLAEARDLVQSIGSEHTSAAVSNTAQIPGGQRRKAKNNRNATPKRSVFSSS